MLERWLVYERHGLLVVASGIATPSYPLCGFIGTVAYQFDGKVLLIGHKNRTHKGIRLQRSKYVIKHGADFERRIVKDTAQQNVGPLC